MYQVVKKFYREDEVKPWHVDFVCNCKTGDEAWRMMSYLESQCNDPMLGDLVQYDIEEF